MELLKKVEFNDDTKIAIYDIKPEKLDEFAFLMLDLKTKKFKKNIYIPYLIKLNPIPQVDRFIILSFPEPLTIMLDIYKREKLFDMFFLDITEFNPFKTENPPSIDLILLTIDYKEKKIIPSIELKEYLEKNPDNDVLLDFAFFEDLYNKNKEIYK